MFCVFKPRSLPGILTLTLSKRLGEGWSDAMALFLTRRATDTGAAPAPIGWYVLGGTETSGGIRRYPYSTNMSVSPLLFSQLQRDTEIHRIGEVWCLMLYEMFWALVEAHGFSSNWYFESMVN